MNRRTLSILLAAAVVLVALAMLVSGRRNSSSGNSESAPLFPSLNERVNDIASIEVSRGSERTLIERRGSEWRVPSKGGYPAKFELVKQTIMSVASLEPVERKTSKPDLYERIGVEDPGPESEAALVVLRDTEGESLASVIVGQSTFQGSSQFVFVRPLGESQSWLAKGQLDPTPDPMTWIDRELIRLDRERVRRVSITHPDGETLTANRSSGSQTTFDVQGVPDGRELTSPNAATPTANALGYLGLEDVRPRNDEQFRLADAVINEFETFDGLRIRVLLWQIDGDDGQESWVAIEAENIGPLEEPPSDEEVDGAGVNEEGPGVEEETQTLNERLEGWLFRISAAKADALRKRMDDMLKPDATATPGAFGVGPVTPSPATASPSP